MPSLAMRVAAILIVAFTATSGVRAATVATVTLDDMTHSAGRIFGGVCVSAETGATVVAGARILSTTYTFEIRESLKGNGGRTVTFRQVGTPQGGPADLGRAAGLPVYAPGFEYVIFLLPESRARLTSPAGAGLGALPVAGEDVAVPQGLVDRPGTAPRPRGVGEAPGIERLPYRAVRDAILESLRGPSPPRRRP